jgi:hypothetical protein
LFPNTYTAKKLACKPPRRLGGLAPELRASVSNYFLQAGSRTPQQLIADVKKVYT